MEIRTGGLDSAEVVQLLREHLQSAALHSPPESVHALDLDALRRPDITFWSVWENSELLGCGAIKQLDTLHGEIKSMRTASAHLRKGVAAMLLQHILEEARRRSYVRLSLETGSMEAFAPARRLYASVGFTECGPFADYVEDPNSVFMARELQDVSRTLTFVLTLLAMIAFAGNSLLCRLALKDTGIDAASFTSIRIVSGALVLWLIVRLHGARRPGAFLDGSWLSALALFAYAACFSFAYVSLPAATGALLLFGAVQATMIGYGLWTGERLGVRQSAGMICASAGLVDLMLPGVAAPPLVASVLMLGAGCAWGAYSLRGKSVVDPTNATMGNFLRAIPFAIALSAMTFSRISLSHAGIYYAIASGALTSGVGYAIWYTALRGLKATRAAVVQLSVPVFAAIGGIVFLGESISLRLLIASAAILGGIALVIIERSVEPASR